MIDEPDLDRYVNEPVYDDGTKLGTVVDIDTEEGTAFLEPSGEVEKNQWESLGWHTEFDYDEDWEDLDYELWQSGDSDLTVPFDRWPYTIPLDRVEDTDEELQLVD